MVPQLTRGFLAGGCLGALGGVAVATQLARLNHLQNGATNYLLLSLGAALIYALVAGLQTAVLVLLLRLAGIGAGTGNRGEAGGSVARNGPGAARRVEEAAGGRITDAPVALALSMPIAAAILLLIVGMVGAFAGVSIPEWSMALAGVAGGALAVVLRPDRLRIVRRLSSPRTLLYLTAPPILLILAAGAWMSRGAAVRPPVQFEQASGGQRKLLVIGMDGMSWDFTRRLMAAGEMPNLSDLAGRGVASPLSTYRPTLSPLIWTTIATGVRPERHGIEGFAIQRIRGIDASIGRLVRDTGSGLILNGLEAVGLAERVPIGSDLCTAMRFWEVASAVGRTVAVLNWWATWPADPVNGLLVTDRFYYFRDADMGKSAPEQDVGTVYPAEAHDEMAALRVSPWDLTPAQVRRFLDLTDSEIESLGRGEYQTQLIDSEFRFLHSMDETYRRIALKVLEGPDPPDITAVYLRGVDIISHAALKYSDLLDRTDGTAEEERKYGAAVHRYYVYADEVIGGLVAAAGPDTNVLVVSDHGFERQPDGSVGHDNAPEGIFFAAGPDIQSGGDPGKPSVNDVAPTVLYLSGCPVARDLQGRILSDIVRPAVWAGSRPEIIPTFGIRHPLAGGNLGREDEEYLQRLKALGYIQ